MSAAPSYVAVKRKREDAPIQSLILEEPRAKHARVNVEYKLKSVSQPSNEPPPKSTQNQKDTTAAEKGTPSKSPFVKKTDTLAHKAIKHSRPRHFELARGKRSADTAGLLPTFIERPVKRSNVEVESEIEQKSTPLKRPGTKTTQHGAAKGATDFKALGRNEPSAALAAKLSELAFQEAGEPAPKPRVIAQPKRTPRRRKPTEPHSGLPPSTSYTDLEDAPVSDDEYVYDIYIRSTSTPSLPSEPQNPAPTSSTPSFPPTNVPLRPVPTDSTAPRSLTGLPSDLSSFASYSSQHSPSADLDVGYLILPSEAESSYFWSSNTSGAKGGGGSSSSEEDEDDEDSNAEDYYGADYPEDEVDEDDEMGEGAYRFRMGRGSEDEDEFADPGWGGAKNRGEWEDDSDESEGAGNNPWKKFMGRERRAMEEEDGEGDDER
ncbi:hypothetical protein B9Z65_2961 [Elsinoe australis]|uniref:Transcription factor Iwr1 domain-containing protein n=1 Tax=Elsinoe australis TaxID=40998 RepID=A0A2P7ZU06_9PEZI|nr:hypothetical protein B9Z65_2961 [Elsinoe australis]